MNMTFNLGTIIAKCKGFLKPKAIKIYLNLDCRSWHRHSSESLWAETINKSSARLLNVPFFSDQVSFQDIVIYNKIGDKFWFQSVSLRSGYSTIRIRRTKQGASEDFSHLCRKLIQLNCHIENASDDEVELFVIAVPDVGFEGIMKVIKGEMNPPESDWTSGFIYEKNN